MTFLWFNERVTTYERERKNPSVMREHAGLPRNAFDIKWVNTGVRVSVKMASLGGTMVPTPIATFTIGATWVLDPEEYRLFAPGVDVGVIQTFSATLDADWRMLRPCCEWMDDL